MEGAGQANSRDVVSFLLQSLEWNGYTQSILYCSERYPKIISFALLLGWIYFD
jgi:hypothetical protein